MVGVAEFTGIVSQTFSCIVEGSTLSRRFYKNHSSSKLALLLNLIEYDYLGEE